MKQPPQKVTAIAIRAQNYKEKAKLISLYTKEYGLLSVIAYKPHLYLAPPMNIEALVKPSRSLWTLSEAHLLSANDHLRATLPLIESISMLFKAIANSQEAHHENERLFTLLQSFIEKLPSFKDPQIATLTFLLKFRRLEGTLDLSEISPGSLLDQLLNATSFSSISQLTLPTGARHYLTKNLESIGKNH